METSSSGRRALLVLFTVSGFSGLIYESIWSHYLKLFLGHAAYAQTLVLAIFMGGMAIGSWIVAARSTRLRDLLIGYAIVEGIIGLLGLIFHPLSRAATGWSFDVVVPALGSPVPIQLFKWTLASLLILPQSILLGMTFPLMSGAIVRRHPERSGETLALLYFTNSFGAAVGVLVSGFVLIGRVGLPGTIMTAGLLNVALALVVWGVAKSSQGEPAPLAVADRTAASDRDRQMHRLILIAAAGTGAAAFMYEIGWIRLLALVLGSSTHAFELMLSAFILGIALGGLWIRRHIQSMRDPVRSLGWILLTMSAVALATLHAYDSSFDWMAQVVAMFTPTDAGYVGFNLGSHAIALVLMVPTTFFCGLTLPVMTHVLMRSPAGERAIGSVYAWNTVGSIVGIMLAVHVLMPYMGVKAVMIGGGALHAALGLILLLRRSAPWRLPDFAAAGAAALALVAAVLLLQFDPRRMAAGVYRHGRPAYTADARILYFEHGKTASISLVETEGVVSIGTNGKPDAAINMAEGVANPDEITMVMAGALPLAMLPGARSVANIGIGSGLTTHVLLEDPDLTRVDTVEIEPFMVDAARRGFLARVRNAFEDPRSHIYIEDAKTFFATRQERYDVIVSEPSNPWVSGVASLFSGEFYAQVKHYLKPDGLMVQWVQIYETDLDVLTSVLKALADQFSDFALYRTDDANVLIVAVQQGKVPEPNLTAMFAGKRRAALERVGVMTPRDVTARLVGTKDLLAPALLSSGVPRNSDYFPYVDQHAVRARVLRRNAVAVSVFAARPIPMIDMLLQRPAPEGELGDSIAADSHLDRLARGARILHRAVVHGDDENLADESARQLAMLDAPAARCETRTSREAWVDTVFTLTQAMTPTLSRQGLDEYWAALDRKACAQKLRPEDRQFLRLLQAVSLRRSAEAAATGRQLIDSRYVFGSAEQYAFALQATAVAALANDDSRHAGELLQRMDAEGIALETWEHRVLHSLVAFRGAGSATR